MFSHPVAAQVRVVTTHGKYVAHRICQGQTPIRVLQNLVVDVELLGWSMLEERTHCVQRKLRVQLCVEYRVIRHTLTPSSDCAPYPLPPFRVLPPTYTHTNPKRELINPFFVQTHDVSFESNLCAMAEDTPVDLVQGQFLVQSRWCLPVYSEHLLVREVQNVEGLLCGATNQVLKVRLEDALVKEGAFRG